MISERMLSLIDAPSGAALVWYAAAALAPGYFAHWYRERRKTRRADDVFAAQNGCQRVQATIPYKWPFALDLLKVQYDALQGGHLLEFQTQFINTAPTTRINIMGEGYIINDPANIEAILTTHFDDSGLGPRRIGLLPLLGEGIFSQDDIAWRHSRELLRRQFARVREAGLAAFEFHVHELLAAITQDGQTSADGIVDMQPHFFEYTLGTTTDLLFGEPHSSLPEADRDALRDNFEYASLVSAIRLRLAYCAWLYTPPKFRDACKGVRVWASFFANKALDYLEQHGEEEAMKKYAFITDLWLEMRDRDLVRDQLFHVLLAGRDTTACLLSWTM